MEQRYSHKKTNYKRLVAWTPKVRAAPDLI